MIHRTRLCSGVLFVCAVLATRAAAQPPITESIIRVVHVDGHAVRVQVSGLANREAGRPIIVFEAGATNSLEAWRSVVPQLVGVAPLVAYDRAGLGESDWDGQTPAPRHVSDRLRRILREIDAAPPYVLVGHSWGGSLMRFFAGYHPAEVAGIVYVDPGPIVTQSPAAELAPFEAIGAGRAGYDAFWSGYEAILERASPAVRAEFGVYRRMMQEDVAERDIRPCTRRPGRDDSRCQTVSCTARTPVRRAAPFPRGSASPDRAAAGVGAGVRTRHGRSDESREPRGPPGGS